MKKKLLVASLLALAGTGAMAQSNAFEGFSAGVKVSSVGTSTTISDNAGSVNLGQQSIVPTVELGYAYGVSKEIVLGLTATYDLTETKAGSVNNVNLKGENHYSINFKPGYVFNNTTQVYAIVGYNSMTGKISNGGAKATSTYNGFGGGAGIQALISKNIYVQAEVQQLTYDSKTFSGVTVKPSATVGTLGLGYKF
ncbi:outer membrane protein [Polynucleobacter sp. UB-Piko-W3]|uniref:outer membrane protein n=1 Tax=Polynucleobacter sp. UB-Piko-W3 TaxID=1819735 RepID=UPI001C0DBA15|nr:outer membrane beta-barrel protein [Polynucleobacter sp. UB-Piko-W3]MBU3555094.1 porin family protein [Polynucleobacter sp. UB-Piko-W3]